MCNLIYKNGFQEFHNWLPPMDAGMAVSDMGSLASYFPLIGSSPAPLTWVSL